MPAMQRNTLQARYEQGDRNFQKADLSGVDLSGLDLREADFRGADLYGTQLMDSLLCRADFSEGANLEHANLQGADLSEANLSGASLDKASLDGAIAKGTVYDQKTIFPVGFDIIAAGGIEVQELERQSRIASVTQLKAQAAQSTAAAPEPIAEPSQSFAAVQTSISNITPPAPASNPDDSGLFPATSVTVAPTTTAAPAPKNSSASCLGVSFGIFLVLGLGFAAMSIFKPSTFLQTQTSPFENVQYPQDSCGDPRPTNASDFPVDFYPVFVSNSPNTLTTVNSNFCRDALVIIRKDLGIQSIQVASFTTQQRATQFAQFMTQKVGSGEVGTPTRIFK
jgi:Pentapeptide repeats (8 copies)